MERYKDLNTQLKLAKVFKAVISAGLVTPVFVSVSACEKAKPAVEESEVSVSTIQQTTQTSERTSSTIQETAPSTTEKIPETTAEIKEFDASMIKHRLVFSASAEQFGMTHPEAIFDFKPGAPVPLWYLYDEEKKDGKAYCYAV